MARAFELRVTRQAAVKRGLAWAELTRDIAAETHRTAPRRGVNRNRFKFLRSAPGDAPTTETTRLLQFLSAPPVFFSDNGLPAYRVPVNYALLETGYSRNGRVLEPRPLGRITLSILTAGPRPT